MSFSLVPVKIEFIQDLQYKNNENHKVISVFFDSSIDKNLKVSDLSITQLNKKDKGLLDAVTKRLGISQKHRRKDDLPKNGLKMWGRYKDKRKVQNIKGLSASKSNDT